MEVLPLPDLPQIATWCEGFTTKLTPFKTGSDSGLIYVSLELATVEV